MRKIAEAGAGAKAAGAGAGAAGATEKRDGKKQKDRLTR
jgi:hypothetical protein